MVPPALVLLADDDATFRWILRGALELDGYKVVEATNGAECLASYRANAPDLVLLDAMMPQLDGFACCRQLRPWASQTGTPILMISSLDDRESVDQAFAAGAMDYVTKPIHWAVLRQRLRCLLEQARLFRQVQRFNADLDQQMRNCTLDMRDRTVQLSKSLEFEATLKRITDRVRDSLDERQILQTAVEELVRSLSAGCCNAAIYDLEMRIAHVHYECRVSIAGYQDRQVQMDNAPALYAQLAQGTALHFCSNLPNLDRGRVTMFAQPMMIEDQPIGDLWLINPAERALDELEMRLVQQVANQCAIALRQAHLYQAAQTQVAELAKLNQLKDDFLSTVSHELRSPMANMRLAIQMLERLISKPTANCCQPTHPTDAQKSLKYLRILNTECEREIGLINDILSLQQLEAGQQIWDPVDIHIPTFVAGLVEFCQIQTQQRQQGLVVSLQPHLPTIVSDSSSLKRLLSELLHNACKYTPPAGEIHLTIAVDAGDRAPGAIALPVVLFRVANVGVEIPAAELPRIFDKFYRVPSGDPWKQGGTGLGLALVKQLAAHLGGSVAVTSSPLATCFTLKLPIAR